MSGTTKFIDNSDAFKKALKAAERATIRTAAKTIAKAASENTPSSTGRTKKAYGVKTGKVKGTTNNFKSTVGVWSKSQLKKKGKPIPWQLTAILENGTKAHEINYGRKSTRGKLTRLTGKKTLGNKAKNLCFGRYVNHPGSKAFHMLKNAANSNSGAIKDAAQKYYKELSDKMATSNYEKGGDINTLIGSTLARIAGEEESEDNV